MCVTQSYVQAVLVKLVPCVGLTVLSLLLVNTMNAAEARRRRLLNKTAAKVICDTTTTTAATSSGSDQRDNKTNRTTRMLLTVVVLFLMTELPQGVINLLSGVLVGFVDEVAIIELIDSLGRLVDR